MPLWGNELYYKYFEDMTEKEKDEIANTYGKDVFSSGASSMAWLAEAIKEGEKREREEARLEAERYDYSDDSDESDDEKKHEFDIMEYLSKFDSSEYLGSNKKDSSEYLGLNKDDYEYLGLNKNDSSEYLGMNESDFEYLGLNKNYSPSYKSDNTFIADFFERIIVLLTPFGVLFCIYWILKIIVEN